MATWFLRWLCIDDILQLQIRMVKLYSTLRDVSNTLKHAIITSLLYKKLNLELITENCRLVCNLTFFSKLIEMAVAEQLNRAFYCKSTYWNLPFSLQELLQGVYRVGSVPISLVCRCPPISMICWNLVSHLLDIFAGHLPSHWLFSISIFLLFVTLNSYLPDCSRLS